MRKITFGLANSLDNFIARENHAVDWLSWSKEAAEITGAFWKKVDTMLMGRKTYEAALRMMKGKEGDVAAYAGVKTYVFSRTLPPSETDALEIVSTDAVKFVRKLKGAEGKEICMMGGGLLAQTLFEARLIDEIGLNIHPVLLGSGIPLFHGMKRQLNLELTQCRQFKNGCVYVHYRVKH